jgi:hypothetical protein
VRDDDETGRAIACVIFVAVAAVAMLIEALS